MLYFARFVCCCNRKIVVSDKLLIFIPFLRSWSWKMYKVLVWYVMWLDLKKNWFYGMMVLAGGKIICLQYIFVGVMTSVREFICNDFDLSIWYNILKFYLLQWNIAAVASCCRDCVRFDWPGNQTKYLPHREPRLQPLITTLLVCKAEKFAISVKNVMIQCVC